MKFEIPSSRIYATMHRRYDGTKKEHKYINFLDRIFTTIMTTFTFTYPTSYASIDRYRILYVRMFRVHQQFPAPNPSNIL